MDRPGTIFRPGENCSDVGTARRAAILVDGERYFDAFARATARAERSILIVGWDFDSRMVLTYGANGEPGPTLGEWLNGLARRNHGLHVRILDWDYPMIFGKGREIPPIYGITWRPHRRIDIRYDDTHPMAGSHHQKVVVIDDRLAFAGGLDLTSKRWDSHAHAPGDPRRTFLGEPYPPMHDMMALVDGEAARALSAVARERWEAATGERLHPIDVPGDGWPPEIGVQMREATAAVACTSPPIGARGAVREVERLYLDMIAAARDYVYVENQYFTSQAIADALRASLAKPEGPEIVVLTRLLSHGWLEELTMQALRVRLIRELRAADPHGRFHAYYPHVDGLAENTCIDLHSKLMIVDDEWLRVGSSNLSNRSMGMDSECDVTFEARGDARIRGTIRAFRDSLVAEHTGTEPAAVAQAIAREGSISAAIAALPKKARRIEVLEAPEIAETQLNLVAVADLEKPLPLEGIVREFAPDTSTSLMPGRRLLAGLCVAFAALALAWTCTPLADYVTRANVIRWGEEFSRYSWAPLIVVLAYTPASYTMFPRWFITMISVIAFGPWRGFLYGICGMIVAGVVSYAPGRLVRRDTVRRLAGPRLNRMSAALYHRGALAVAIVRLLPIAPYVVVNLVMGAMRIRLRDFVLGSLVGIVPGMLAATVLSEQISRLLVAPAEINGWLIAIAVVLLVTIVYLGQRWLRRLDREATGHS
ncbi:MAG TPA: VTT domain-containing protein [Usitatibacter sp.]|nr:VTT domain-containing protein [Usitatibacter sp.]